MPPSDWTRVVRSGLKLASCGGRLERRRSPTFPIFQTVLAVFQDWEKPETIPDPDAKKPDDWDDDMDGEWEPPMISNPEFKVRPRSR